MPDTPRPPVLLDGAATDSVAGWHPQDGFDLPGTPWDLSDRRILCVGVVDTEDRAVAAVTALSRGAGLAISLAASGPTRLRLLEDLHRLGDVISPSGSSGSAEVGLDDEQRGLMQALAEGATVTEAAHRMHMSRRTASRRLGEVRQALGVESTAEAVARWTDLT